MEREARGKLQRRRKEIDHEKMGRENVRRGMEG